MSPRPGCTRRRASLGLIAVPALASCTVLTGLSLEGNVGASYFDSVTGPRAEAGAGLQAGIVLSLEYDYNRSSSMGIGAGPQVLVLPTDEGSRTSVAFPSELWLGAAIAGFSSPNVRPRTYFGVQLAQGAVGFGNVYMGFGASLHPAAGRMWHLLVGPQYTGANTEGASHRGWGVVGRVRFLRMFVPSCDRYIDPGSTADGHVPLTELCEERRR